MFFNTSTFFQLDQLNKALDTPEKGSALLKRRRYRCACGQLPVLVYLWPRERWQRLCRLEAESFILQVLDQATTDY